ncbi:universal stress protein [bacterium]|nr:universal stress protein [bacterium]
MKKVLFATDGSHNSQEAANLLARLSCGETLDLVVVTVLQIPYLVLRAGTSLQREEMIAAEQASAVTAFEAIKQTFKHSDTKLRHVTREGHSGKEICDLAANENAELIVTGAKGRSTIERTLLGSTSDYVAHHAPCSVLVARSIESKDTKNRFQIAIGYQDSEAANHALEEFRLTNWKTQSDVHLVSAVSLLSSFQTEIVVDTEKIQQAANSALLEAKDSLAQSGIDATTHLIKADHIADSLVDYTEQHACDLLVVGENQHNILSRIIMGSVSRFVLRYAPCSVWISRNRTQIDSQ